MQKQVEFEEFQRYQKDLRVKIGKDFEGIFDEVLIILNNLIKKIKKIKVDNSAIAIQSKFPENMVKQKPLNLIKKEKKEKKRRMKLSQYDFNLLGKYIRFINYISLQSLIDVYKNSLVHIKEEFFKERKNGMFTTAAYFDQNKVMFTHNLKDIYKVIDYILDENIKLIKDTPKIFENKDFKPYIDSLFKSHIESISYILPEIRDIIYNSREFIEVKSTLRVKIETDLKECRKRVELNYNYCKRVEHEKINFNVEKWITKKPDLDQIKTKLVQLRDYKKDTMERIKD